MAGRVFINYRRSDTQAAAGRLFDRLTQHFAHDVIFMDVDGIEPGADFVSTIEKQVAACGAFLAVIGPGWIDARNAAGSRRLEDPHDNVRVEIESALKRDIRVIPVLVDGARMPQPEELPESIRPLARRNAVEITHHRFGGDVDDLAGVIQRAANIEPINPQPTTLSQNQQSDSWANFLFSFEGRVSRSQYLKGIILVIIFMWFFEFAIIGLVLYALSGGSVEGFLVLGSKAQLPVPAKLGAYVVTLPFYWPVLALGLKRLHDFGQGWGLFILLALLGASSMFADLMENSAIVNYTLVANLAADVLIAAIRGTTGPNQYGPDPLAKKFAKLETKQAA
jgi:uncharacterized membrane protein YhaH (DUF805 family)